MELLVKRAPLRVESEQSLRVRDAVTSVIEGIAAAKYLPLQHNLDPRILELSAEELAEHVSQTVELRLSPRVPFIR
jgi:hypothetical protein